MSSMETTSVSSIMTRSVKTEKEDQNVLAACRIMHENSIRSVIIEKKDDNNNIKPVGIITERDVVRLLGSLNPSLLQTPLRDIMRTILFQRMVRLKTQFSLCSKRIFADF